MRLGDSPEYSFNVGCQPRNIRSAFQYTCTNASIGNTLLNVFDKHFSHQFRTTEWRSRSAIVKVKRRIVICVDSGRDNDIDVGLRGDTLNSRYIATKTD